MVFSKIPSFFRVPKYKTFNISPRYYDPAKEEKKRREERIKAELDRESSNIPDSYSQLSIREFYQQRKSRSRFNSNSRSNARILLIFAVLVLLVYIIFIR